MNIDTYHTYFVLVAVMKGGVSAAALEEYGPGLIAHSIASWLTEHAVPAEFVSCMPSDPHDLPDGGELIVSHTHVRDN